MESMRSPAKLQPKPCTYMYTIRELLLTHTQAYTVTDQAEKHENVDKDVNAIDEHYVIKFLCVPQTNSELLQR